MTVAQRVGQPHGAAGGGEGAHKACLATARHGTVALQTPRFYAKNAKNDTKNIFFYLFFTFF